VQRVPCPSTFVIEPISKTVSLCMRQREREGCRECQCCVPLNVDDDGETIVTIFASCRNRPAGRGGWAALTMAEAPGHGANSARLTTFRLLAKYRFVNKVFKALSDPTRRRVLQLLRQRPMSAGELSDHFAVSKPTMSAHFAVLQEAGLIEAEKSGRTIIYRLVMSVLEEALLGFAQTFGWGLESKRATRFTHHKLAKRTAKGEV
jgi:DNA-binding transcriptional ArsR family regulator